MRKSYTQEDIQNTIYNSKNPTRRWLHRERKKRILSAIESYAFQGMVSLEIGPGSGLYLPALQKKSSQLYVSDIEAVYLEGAARINQEENPIVIINDDITDTKLPKNFFDMIICSEVVEHLSDTFTAIHNIFESLKPGGVVILSTPQKYSFLEMAGKVAFLPGVIDLVRLIYREPILKTGHISLLTEKQIKKQIKSVGFEIVGQDKSGLYLPIFSEIFGEFAVKFQEWAEMKIKDTWLDGVVWTQYYVLRKVVKVG